MFNKLDIVTRIANLLSVNKIPATKFAEDMGGKASGYSKDTVYTWRTSRSTSYMDDLERIAQYLNVSTDYLLTGNESNTANDTTSEKENERVGERFVDFEIVKKGLHDCLFKERPIVAKAGGRDVTYTASYYSKDFAGVDSNAIFIDSLVKKTGILKERLDIFAELCLLKNEPEDKSSYPTSYEFDRIISVSKCEEEYAVKLKQCLRDEFETLKNEAEAQQLGVYAPKAN